MHEPCHPGEILLEEVLTPNRVSISAAAERFGLTRVALSRIVNGHAAIRPHLAVRLEDAGFGTARVWLAMQAAHDIWRVRADRGAVDVTPQSA